MDSQSLEKVKQFAINILKHELLPGLYYHDLVHTINDVVPATSTLAELEGIMDESLQLLLTAAWFHDLGFIKQRTGHEQAAAKLALEVLPGFGYSETQIRVIRGIIMATVLPQSPTTLLEKIMADADLDVLGRDDFMLRSEKLRQELAYFGTEYSDAEWYREQLKFVQAHTYFTESARSLRNPGQLNNIAHLKRILSAY